MRILSPLNIVNTFLNTLITKSGGWWREPLRRVLKHSSMTAKKDSGNEIKSSCDKF